MHQNKSKQAYVWSSSSDVILIERRDTEIAPSACRIFGQTVRGMTPAERERVAVSALSLPRWTVDHDTHREI